MDSSSQSATALLGLWILFSAVGSLLLVGGCIYALYCLGRIGAQLERLAASLESMNSRDEAREATRARTARDEGGSL